MIQFYHFVTYCPPFQKLDTIPAKSHRSRPGRRTLLYFRFPSGRTPAFPGASIFRPGAPAPGITLREIRQRRRCSGNASFRPAPWRGRIHSARRTSVRPLPRNACRPRRRPKGGLRQGLFFRKRAVKSKRNKIDHIVLSGDAASSAVMRDFCRGRRPAALFFRVPLFTSLSGIRILRLQQLRQPLRRQGL